VCNAITLPFQEESVEETIARFSEKSGSAEKSVTGIIKEYTGYTLRNGPYGPYLTKKETALRGSKPARRPCVSLPKGLSADSLTETEVAALYQSGLEKKKFKSG